jgi:hypothetical protein
MKMRTPLLVVGGVPVLRSAICYIYAFVKAFINGVVGRETSRCQLVQYLMCLKDNGEVIIIKTAKLDGSYWVLLMNWRKTIES